MIIEVVLADNHATLRRMVCQLLETDSDIRVVGEAASGQEAIELVKQHQPDVLVTDLAMPHTGGFEVIQTITRMGKRPAILALSIFTDRQLVDKALQCGAKGFVGKESIAQELVAAVHTVARGESYLSRARA